MTCRSAPRPGLAEDFGYAEWHIRNLLGLQAQCFEEGATVTGPDDSELSEQPYGDGPIPNPYQPVDTAQPLAAQPRSAVDVVSQRVNRVAGGVILGLALLGIMVMMANGAPWVAAVLMLSPVFPAVGIFGFRTCRLSWWADLWINVAISVAVGLSLLVAAAVVCTAVVLAF